MPPPQKQTTTTTKKTGKILNLFFQSKELRTGIIWWDIGIKDFPWCFLPIMHHAIDNS